MYLLARKVKIERCYIPIFVSNTIIYYERTGKKQARVCGKDKQGDGFY